jgi:hypothetical protein
LARKRRKSGNADGSRKRPARQLTQATPSQGSETHNSRIAVLSVRLIWIVALVAALIVVAAGVSLHLRGDNRIAPAASFVGSETCAGCHQTEARLWDASQHKAAMQHATDKTVLGDFNDGSFDYYGVHSRFFRRGDQFLVETDGPDGTLAVFAVK